MASPSKSEEAHKPGEKPTLEKQYDIAVQALRHAHRSVRELTDTEIKEHMPHLPISLDEAFIFADEYVAHTGSGMWITPRGTLLIRMIDGY